MNNNVKMRIGVFMMLFSIGLFAQNANHTSSDYASNAAISKVFSPIVLDAYKEQAKAKINDLYSYLNLWSKETDSTTSNEIKNVIKKLFIDNNVKFQYLDSNTPNFLTIDQFLESIKRDKLQFAISRIELNEIQNNFFEMKYVLEIQNVKNKKEIISSQKVYLSEKEKQFGTNKKRVWELRIGDFYIN
ncbi:MULTISPECIES: hypothetical protein [Flavobacterium]|uniref:Uncharacterized protein n=1 Tax=Flavobacterium hankyongi TaxID=1176532 RepID=A0ABP8ZYK8_9FLAO|nr:hypothetical protein [Flavobacterium sp. N1846]